MSDLYVILYCAGVSIVMQAMNVKLHFSTILESITSSLQITL